MTRSASAQARHGGGRRRSGGFEGERLGGVGRQLLRALDQPWAAQYLAVSAVIALPTVILAFFYGQSRIFFVMARYGLLPRSLARVSGRGSPTRITLFTAVLVAILAGLIPLAELAALANAGTLTAFAAVAVCMLVMRRRAPDAPRTFRTPLPWLVGAAMRWLFFWKHDDWWRFAGCGYDSMPRELPFA